MVFVARALEGRTGTTVQLISSTDVKGALGDMAICASSGVLLGPSPFVWSIK
jgi:hypothetical protein